MDMFCCRHFSSQLVSLAVRSVGSPRAFQRGISKLPSNNAYNEYDHELLGPHYFQRRPDPNNLNKPSTAQASETTLKLIHQHKLLRAIQSQITIFQDGLDKFRAVEGSDEFPFKMIERGHYSHPQLKRELDDEIVYVSVDERFLYPSPVNDPAKQKQKSNTMIPMDVSVFRKSAGMILDCNLSALPDCDEISVHSFWIRKAEHSEPLANHPAWAKTGMADLDEDLEEKLIKYLEVLGVKANTIEIWKANLKHKENRDCLKAMEDFKGFLEKEAWFPVVGRKE